MDLTGNNLILIIVAVGVLLAIILLVFFVISKSRKKVTPQWKLKAATKYNHLIEKSLSLKDFILEGDKLLEFILKSKFKSEDLSMGEILQKQAKSFRYNELNDIWFAHKIRNKLVHDIDYQATPSDLNAAKIIYKKVLRLLIEQ